METYPALEYMKERPVDHIFEVLREPEHPDRPTCFFIRQPEPMFLSFTYSLIQSTRTVKVPAKGQTPLPLGVGPSVILVRQSGVIHACACNG